MLRGSFVTILAVLASAGFCQGAEPTAAVFSDSAPLWATLAGYEVSTPQESALTDFHPTGWLPSSERLLNSNSEIVFRGQSQGSGGGGGGGAGAAAATDPSVPLTQFQFQNTFVPNTYNADGYANTFVIQPVVPLHLNWDFFPYHIIRPTLPIIAPTADPDGPAGVEGGLGDLTILDIYMHPINVTIQSKLVRELQSFAKTWSKNLEDQGFLDAARKEVKERGQDSPDEQS